MVRRRKIPVRKHHGIRDPLKQLEEKEKRLRGVTNNPPDLKNDQKLSYKFRQFKQLADNAKAGKKLQTSLSDINNEPPASKKRKGKGAKDVPIEVDKFQRIEQLPNEDDRAYMRRVNRITHDSLNEAKYEAKYGVKVVRNPKTGEISIQKKPPNEIDELLKRRRLEAKHKNKKPKKKDGVNEGKAINPKLAKEIIKQALREEKEESLKEQQKEQMEFKRDVFQFGEVVHGPPNLTALPRKANKHETVARPGRKANLQLRSFFEATNGEKTNVVQKTSSRKAKISSDLHPSHAGSRETKDDTNLQES